MYFGKSILRKEDTRFLRGKGLFTDDIALPDMTYMAFVRSTHSNAILESVDTTPARSVGGVIDTFTATDWHQDNLGQLVCVHPMPFSDGRPMNEKLRPVFAENRVSHVGEVLACVVGETKNQALDGAEAVNIKYKPLKSVTNVKQSLENDAPIIHPEIGSNVVFEIEKGDRSATKIAFERAHHITAMTLVSNRVAGNPMETRSFLADYEEISQSYTLWCTSQIPHYFRRWLAKFVLYEPEHHIRVVSPDVGGGFGLKIHLTEGAIVTWASKKIGRPVKWTATRQESFLSDSQARDHHTKARMAFDDEGRITGMEVDTIAALGGYLSQFAPSIPGNSYPQTITGLYKSGALDMQVRGAYTNTLPVDAYRGSGRPEATYVNERLIENGARELGIDVTEIRRRNLISAKEFPFQTKVGRIYDSGDPPRLFDQLLSIADYPSLRNEQMELREKGVLMGIGLACFLDKSGTGSSRNLASKGGLHGGYESANVRMHSDGKVTIYSGSHSHGQGHHTAFCQIAADVLGLSVDDIELVQGDTDRVPFGNGTWGSRSASVGGPAIVLAAEKLRDKAGKLAAHIMECSETDLKFDDGIFKVEGTDHSITFEELADISYHASNLPQDGSVSPGLDETVFYEPSDTNDPQAMHLVVVIVDEDTGSTTIRDYFTADDCGRIINPMIVEGQVHGGLAQGIGQALMEQVVYSEKDDGQLIVGSFMDYAMPRALDMPSNLSLAFIEDIPCPSNVLGVKGGSETGTIGPPAAIGNAIVDALWHLGVRHVELPFTSNNVWNAIELKKGN